MSTPVYPGFDLPPHLRSVFVQAVQPSSVARWTRWSGLVALLVWIALAVLWVQAWRETSPGIALLGVMVLVILPRLWLPLGSCLMVAVQRSRGEPAPSFWQAFRIGWQESGRAASLYGRTMPLCEHVMPDALPLEEGTGPRGVVLVHGWMCHRGVWNDWLRALQAQGIPCAAVSVPALWGSIDAGRDIVDAAMRRMTEATGQTPVVVAHSMGGLVVRDWLRSRAGDAQPPVHAVMTLGSPHAGTWMARWGVGQAVAQMREGSAFLQALAQHEQQPGAWVPQVPWVCAWAEADAIVFPQRSSLLPGKAVRALPGQGHLGLVEVDALMQEVVQWVRGAQVPTS